MRMRIWSFGVGLGVWAIAGVALAAFDCNRRPTCEEMGYTNNVGDCEDSDMLKCPFDQTKGFCRSGLNDGVIPAPVVEPVACDVGTILAADKKCYNIIANVNKTFPIGVVFDKENRLAVAMKDKAYIPWGKSYILGNIGCNCSSLSILDTCAVDGKANTKAIVDYLGDSSDYAAGYCYNYTTPGTEKGDWFLPSAQQFDKIIEGIGYSSNFMLSLLQPDYGDSLMKYRTYWSSVLVRESARYSPVATLAGSWYMEKGTLQEYVRCIIAF